MPYLYTSTEETSRTGLPIMRPLFLEFPNATTDGHPIDLDAGNEFLLGPSLLIAPSPSPEEVGQYEVNLPPGVWFDYWTGERLDRRAQTAARDQGEHVAVNPRRGLGAAGVGHLSDAARQPAGFTAHLAAGTAADPAAAEIPVIMLTARAEEEDVFKGYGTGAQWYLTKPFEPGELRRVVRHLLERRGRGEAGSGS